jgi:phage terminase large subunit-like protein
MTANDFLYYYDKSAANKAVQWIEKYCTHVKGELAGKALKLTDWQKEEIVKPMFGWKRRKDGLRKYKRVFVFVPRKNGKSTLGAPLGLYLLCADGEKGSEVYSVASDRKQAGIVHDVAKTMVLNSTELSTRLEIYQNSITYKKAGSSYKVISSDVRRQHGHNAHGIIFDELHTQPNRELWDVMTTATGARSQPLVVAFTTAGFDRQSICYEIYQYAKKVKAGIIHDDTFLSVIYEADENDDINDESTWAKANPNYGVSLKKQYVKEEAKRATQEPGYENTFKRLQLNLWTSSETKWINDATWMACGDLLQEVEKMECYCGLDLASTRDITAFVMLFPRSDGTFDLLPHFFIPELNARERSRKDGVNYDEWIRNGYMWETPGNSTDYDFVRMKINELNLKYNIKSISFDRWNSSQLVINLMGDGFEMSPFGQGYGSMSSPTKELEKLIISKQIRHGGHPVLRWMCSNVMIQRDPADNIKINKSKSKEKVDGMVASVMALGEYITKSPSNTGPSIYESRGILTIE